MSNNIQTNTFINMGTILHKRLLVAKKAIDECHITSGTHNPRGMLLLGPSNMGKTTIIDSYMHDFPILESVDGMKITVLKLTIPSNVSKSDFYSILLKELNDPNPTRGKLMAQRFRAIRLIKNLGVEIIIIDDVHRILPQYGFRKTQILVDEFRDIQRDTGCPLILVGLDSSIRIIDDANKGGISTDQLGNRLRAPFYLKPYYPEDKEWLIILKTFQGLLHNSSIKLSNEVLSKRLWLATKGLIGSLAEIIRESVYYSDSGILTIESLSKGFEHSQQTRFPYHPFKITPYKVDQFLVEETENA